MLPDGEALAAVMPPLVKLPRMRENQVGATVHPQLRLVL